MVLNYEWNCPWCFLSGRVAEWRCYGAFGKEMFLCSEVSMWRGFYVGMFLSGALLPGLCYG